jgi:hypothetical protein
MAEERKHVLRLRHTESGNNRQNDNGARDHDAHE